MSLGQALGWKYGHEPGIETVDNIITKWPLNLGIKPTQVEIDTIISEYQDHKTKMEALLDTGLSDDIENVMEAMLMSDSTMFDAISEETLDKYRMKKTLRNQ